MSTDRKGSHSPVWVFSLLVVAGALVLWQVLSIFAIAGLRTLPVTLPQEGSPEKQLHVHQEYSQISTSMYKDPDEAHAQGRVIASAEIDLRKKRLVSGRVSGARGAAANPAVFVYKLTQGKPMRTPLRIVPTDHNGRFAFPADPCSDLAIVVPSPPMWAPASAWVRPSSESEIDVGTLYMDRGLQIRGSIYPELHQQGRLVVEASLSDEDRKRATILDCGDQSIAWLQGHAVLAVSRTLSDKTGAFEVGGLSSATYNVGPADDFENPECRFHEGARRKCGMSVQAPATGVVVKVQTAALVIAIGLPDSISDENGSDPIPAITKNWTCSLRDRTGFVSSACYGDARVADSDVEQNVREFRVIPGENYFLKVTAPGYQDFQWNFVAPMAGNTVRCDATLRPCAAKSKTSNSGRD